MKTALELFKQLAEQNLYELRSDCMLVEALPRPELKTSGGIILSDNKRSLDNYSADKPQFVKVIQVGAGVQTEDGTNEPLPFSVGDIILVGPLATVKWCSDLFGLVSNTAEFRLGIMQGDATNAFMTFKTMEDYNKAWELTTEFQKTWK